jgi:pSer/pThr/pTyr-binding forkhead associated (FHA) protein
MRCILSIDTGPAAGEALCLRGEDVVQIGRTFWADHCIPDDPHLSRVHFIVESQRDQLRIRDLGSANGTWVNGLRIDQAELQHGDVIVAGRTSFRVQFDRLDPRRTVYDRETLVVPSTEVFPYTQQMLRSGIFRYEGADARASRRGLLRCLRTQFRSHLLVNFKRAEMPLPPELVSAPDLMQCLPESARQANSLVLVNSDDRSVQDDLIERLWGRDAISILISDATDLAPALTASFAHFVRPSLFRSQIDMAPRELTSRLLAPLAAVLVEAESPRTWKLYANPAVADWKKLGLPVGPCNALAGR